MQDLGNSEQIQVRRDMVNSRSREIEGTTQSCQPSNITGFTPHREVAK